jgi:hypothetical protein
MKRLALVLILAAVLPPGAARAGYCSPLNCAASQFTLGGGQLLGFRTAAAKPLTVVDLRSGEARWVLPAGLVGGNFLVHQEGLTLEWYDATTGDRAGSVALPRAARLVGVSQDGQRAVVLRLVPRSTQLTVVSRDATRSITLAGRNWDFDALRGDKLFLVKYLRSGAYQIRLAHVGRGTVDARPLKDPHESGTIWGQAFSRVASEDGRYLFTLYIGSNGAAMVHALDLATAKARCIDLPGTGDFGSATSWGMAVSRDARTLWAVSPGYQRAVAIDVRARRVTQAFAVELPYWNRGNGSRVALSSDGSKLALTDGETVAEVSLRSHRVTRASERATAVGYSPTGRLWKLV